MLTTKEKIDKMKLWEQKRRRIDELIDLFRSGDRNAYRELQAMPPNEVIAYMYALVTDYVVSQRGVKQNEP